MRAYYDAFMAHSLKFYADAILIAIALHILKCSILKMQTVRAEKVKNFMYTLGIFTMLAFNLAIIRLLQGHLVYYIPSFSHKALILGVAVLNLFATGFLFSIRGKNEKTIKQGIQPSTLVMVAWVLLNTVISPLLMGFVMVTLF